MRYPLLAAALLVCLPAVALSARVKPAARLRACKDPKIVENCWLYKPCELVADIDGDGKPDRALLVSRGEKGPKGIAVLFGDGRCVVAGAGKAASSSDDADMKWVANWSVDAACSPDAKGACILLIVAESSGRWLFWDGAKIRVEE